MGFAIGRRANLTARDFITELEAGFRGDTLIAAIAKVFAGAANNRADSAGIFTRSLTTENNRGA